MKCCAYEHRGTGEGPLLALVDDSSWPARAAKRSTTKVSDALYSRRLRPKPSALRTTAVLLPRTLGDAGRPAAVIRLAELRGAQQSLRWAEVHQPEACVVAEPRAAINRTSAC